MNTFEWADTSSDWHDALMGKAELSGDALRERLAALAAELSGPVQDYLDSHPDLSVAEHDAHIRAGIIAPAVQTINRRAQGAPRLPGGAADRVFERLRGLGPIAPLLEDLTITQALITGPGKPAFVERAGRWVDTDIVCTEEEILHAIDRMQLLAGGGHPLNRGNPVVEIFLPRARVTCTDKSLLHNGPGIALRLRSEEALTADDLLAGGMLPPAAFSFLADSLRAGANIIVGGDMGAGKTTFMQALLLTLPPDRHIVTIENPVELDLHALPHVSQLAVVPADLQGRGGVDARALVRHGLRLKANHMVMGEVRDGAAWDMVDVLSWGHGGSVSTVHGGSPRAVWERLETLCLWAHDAPPLPAVRRTMARALDLIVIVRQRELAGESRRVVTAIAEVQRLEGDNPVIQDLWTWEEDDGLRPTGADLSEHLADLLKSKKIVLPLPAGPTTYRALLEKHDGEEFAW